MRSRRQLAVERRDPPTFDDTNGNAATQQSNHNVNDYPNEPVDAGHMNSYENEHTENSSSLNSPVIMTPIPYNFATTLFQSKVYSQTPPAPTGTTPNSPTKTTQNTHPTRCIHPTQSTTLNFHKSTPHPFFLPQTIQRQWKLALIRLCFLRIRTERGQKRGCGTLRRLRECIRRGRGL
ncbi:hypothetical protein BC829DRAFT_175287 [Chytridium lagenaria]|nr:hypothetical protein BC829DRAFT_175287 [Chytridium lagenaria]